MRFCWAPFETVLIAVFDEPRSPGTTPGFTNTEIGLLLGVCATTVCRWQADGLSWVQADRLAIRIGRMPWEIWPEWEPYTTELAEAWCVKDDSRCPSRRGGYRKLERTA